MLFQKQQCRRPERGRERRGTRPCLRPGRGGTDRTGRTPGTEQPVGRRRTYGAGSGPVRSMTSKALGVTGATVVG